MMERDVAVKEEGCQEIRGHINVFKGPINL
jgi:hypothetical protein